MGAMIRSVERDGETRAFGHGHSTVASAGGATLGRAVFEPGWRWSADIGPIAGTASCMTRHLGYVISGAMTVRMDDGIEMSMKEGDIFDLPPGHDAWTDGDQPCVLVDFGPETARYARPATDLPAEDDHMRLVRRGYAAFNSGDTATLRELMSHDVVHHVAGTGPLAGAYKGIDAVLGYYATLGEMTGGQFRSDLIDVFGDGGAHVTALHQMTATRNGVTRVSRGTILFTFLGDRATDLLEMHEDLAGDDAFMHG
jgi:ketosteroid isomerase-like protein